MVKLLAHAYMCTRYSVTSISPQPTPSSTHTSLGNDAPYPCQDPPIHLLAVHRQPPALGVGKHEELQRIGHSWNLPAKAGIPIGFLHTLRTTG